MGPTSNPVLFAGIILALVTVVGAVLVWERPLGRWQGLVRALALVLCPLTALGAASVVVNNEVQIYPTWTEMLGVHPTAARSRAPAAGSPGAPEAAPVPQPAPAQAHGRTQGVQ